MGYNQNQRTCEVTAVSDTHKLIDTKATTKNPFSLEIQEIIFGLLVDGPSLGAFERLKRGEPIPELYTLLFEFFNCFRSVWTTRRGWDFCEKGMKDGLGIKWHSCGLRGIYPDRQRGRVGGKDGGV
jgi:hypothetical protein